MTSTIEILQKTVNDRDVIAFRKEYGGEEHEVFAPTDQAIQVLLTLLTTINDEREGGEQFVLCKKRDVGEIGGADVVSEQQQHENVVRGVVAELYGEEKAEAVVEVIADE